MTIHMTQIDSEWKYVDEMYGILSKYKPLSKKPKTKIGPRTRKLIPHLIISLVLAVLMIAGTTRKGSSLNGTTGLVLAGMLLAIAVFDTVYLCLLCRTAKNIKMNENNSYLTMDENEVVLDNKVQNLVVTVPWDKIQYVIVAKHTVSFMPYFSKNNNTRVIVCNILYKHEIVDAVKALGRENQILYKD